MTTRVLIVDDEPEITSAIQRALRKEPYDLMRAHSAAEALELMSRHPIDVVISDEKMPGMSGTEFLQIVADRYPQTIRMVLTGHANIGEAMQAITHGKLYHYFTKPWKDEDLIFTIRQALDHKMLT